MDFKVEGCISYTPHRLSRMDECVEKTKTWIPLSLPRHCPHRAWSVAGVFYKGEVGMPCEVSVTEQILQISRNPGGTGHAQTVCTKLFFLHPRTRA